MLLEMHAVLPSTWGGGSFWYRGKFKGARASSKPNRSRGECQNGLTARKLLAAWASAGNRCCRASWTKLGAGERVAAGGVPDNVWEWSESWSD